MAKCLIIGGCSNYSWNDVRYWVNSIKATGYKDDIALVGSNLSNDFLTKLKSEGIISVAFSQQQTAPHVERFFHIWTFLKENPGEYHTVIFTDVRDVVFQKNPDVALDNICTRKNTSLIASSEGLKYKDEPWNCQNMQEAFGPVIYERLRNSYIYNVGVIAGRQDDVRDLALMLYQMSINRPIPIVDQAVFNFLIHHYPYREHTRYTYNVDAWAAQLGATLGAVEAGAGDLGMSIKRDPSKKDDYIRAYDDIQPVIKNDLVTNGTEPFAIVHQWDRVPAVKEIVERKYGGGKETEYIIIRT